LDAARWNLSGGKYFVATWLSQQASEKALKALLLERQGRMPPRTHDLRLLGRALGAPPPIAADLDVLIPAFGARYPDDVGEPPVDSISEEMAASDVATASRVIEWVRQQLLGPSSLP
jgi:HEPN domain-containing protein